MRGAIATGLRAAARSKHIDQRCIRCGNNEDDFHLFFDCKFSQAVWFASPLGLRVEGLKRLENTHIPEIIGYILMSYNNKESIPTILSILWSIWKA
jgi:deoxyhypusine synthase